MRSRQCSLLTFAALLSLALITNTRAANAQTDQTIYNGALANNWGSYSWCQTDFASANYRHTGPHSIKVTYTGPWQGFYLAHSAFSTNNYLNLTFWINGGAVSGRRIDVAGNLNGNATFNIDLAPFIDGGQVLANTWKQVTVPLAAIGIDNAANCTGFWLQEYSGKAQSSFYIADITLVAGTPPPTYNPTVTLNVDANANRHAINPNIYGVAYGTTQQLQDLNCPLNRMGGNNTTRYNWQLNADNRASDYYFESIGDTSSVAGMRGDSFISNTEAAGAQTMLTIPTLGWVAKLGPNRGKLASFSVKKYGAQTSKDYWFHDAGNGIRRSTRKAITRNNPNDANVPSDVAFQQGWVNHLIGTHGAAANGGLKYYILDNEPSLWHGTHRDVHPTGATMNEILTDTIDYAGMIKAADPSAQIVGPEEWGWSGYFYSGYDQQYGSQHGWGYLPDRTKNGGMDYLPWLLAQLHTYDVAHNTKSLDVFTVHYYPQGGEYSNNVSPAMQQTRNRSTRSLWDPTYVDKTWINSAIQLVPRIKSWVAQYYPGLQTGVTEYSWGADGHINGATTQADVWGILGREGIDLATRWTVASTGSPVYNAMKLIRNYDGAKSAFGDVSVAATAPDPDAVSVFAAQRTSDGALTVLVINKIKGITPVTLNVANFAGTGIAQVYQLTAANAITRLTDLTVSGGALTFSVPDQSITLLVLTQ